MSRNAFCVKSPRLKGAVTRLSQPFVRVNEFEVKMHCTMFAINCVLYDFCTLTVHLVVWHLILFALFAGRRGTRRDG